MMCITALWKACSREALDVLKGGTSCLAAAAWAGNEEVVRHRNDGVKLLLAGAIKLGAGLHDPVGVAGERPAGDAAHEGPFVQQLGQQHSHHLRQVPQ